MINKKFNHFKYNLLLESVLEVSPDFLEIIKAIVSSAGKGSGVANTLLDWITKGDDISTNFNLLGTSKENDKILYLQDRQFQRFKQEGQDPEKRTRIEAAVGKIARSLLSDNGKSFTDTEIEEFVNVYKAHWNRKFNPRQFSIVSGDEILYWYLEQNYYNGGNSTLGNSCMRSRDKNLRMKIYADNPDKVSMMIFTYMGPNMPEPKLLARALIWKLDSGDIFVDRIYYNNDEIYEECNNWLKQKFPGAIHREKELKTSKSLRVTLNKSKYQVYPYVDTIYYLENELSDGKITSSPGVLTHVHEPTTNKLVSQLRDHRFGIPSLSHLYFNKLDEYYLDSDCVEPVGLSTKWPKKYCKLSNLYSRWIKDSEGVWSEALNDWIDFRHAVELPGIGIVDKRYVFQRLSYIGASDFPWKNWTNSTSPETREKNIEIQYIVSPTKKLEPSTTFGPDFDIQDNFGAHSSSGWDISQRCISIHGRSTVRDFSIPVIRIRDIQDIILYLRGLSIPIYEGRKKTDKFYSGEFLEALFNSLLIKVNDNYYLLPEDVKLLKINELYPTPIPNSPTGFLSPHFYTETPPGQLIEKETMIKFIENSRYLTPREKRYRLSLGEFVYKNNPSRSMISYSPENRSISYGDYGEFLQASKRFYLENVDTESGLSEPMISWSLDKPSTVKDSTNYTLTGNETKDEIFLRNYLAENGRDLMQIHFWYKILYNGNSTGVKRLILKYRKNILNEGFIQNPENFEKLLDLYSVVNADELKVRIPSYKSWVTNLPKAKKNWEQYLSRLREGDGVLLPVLFRTPVLD